MNNIELLATWRYKIDWVNVELWDGYDSSWSIYDDYLGVRTLTHNDWGTTSISKFILKKNTNYKIKYKLKNYDDGSYNVFQGGMILRVGNNSYTNSTIGEYEYTFNSYNNQSISFEPLTPTSLFGINDIVIEELQDIKIDLFEETEIYLNFDFNDIKILNSKSGSYSKEFKVPGTQSNNEFFNFMFMINVDGTFNKYTKVFSSIRTQIGDLMNGYIQLKNIEKTQNGLFYNIVFYSDVVDLFTEIGDMKLNDLDFSDIKHTASYSHIIATWDQYQGLGYVYPYIDYGMNQGKLDGSIGNGLDEGGKGLSICDLRPALTLKKIIDKIFEKLEKEYTSTLFNSSDFKRMILPYSNKSDALDDYYLVAKIRGNTAYDNWNFAYNTCFQYSDFQSGLFDTNVSYYYGTNGIVSSSYWFPGRYTKFDTEYDVYERFNNNTNTSNSPTATDKISYQNVNYKWEYNSTSQSYDVVPDYQFNAIIPGTYLVRKEGKYKMKIRFKINNFTSGKLRLYSTQINTAGVIYDVSDPINTEDNRCTVTNEIATLIWEYDSTIGYHERTININARVGDMIGFKIVSNNATGNFDGFVDYIEIYEYGFGANSIVDMNKAVDNNMKIKDIFTDILTLTNAIVVKDKETDKYIIENKLTYFNNSGSSWDWSDKIDNNQIKLIESPSDFQSKNTIFKYEKGDDYWNKYYEENKDDQELNYGGKIVRFENDFNNNKKEIKLNTKSSILLSLYDSKTDSGKKAIYYTSYRKSEDYKFDTKIGQRFLYFNYLNIYDNTNTDLRFRLEGSTLHGQATPHYPYAGHLQNPYSINTTYDLNFDTRLYSNGKWYNMFDMDKPFYTKPIYNCYKRFWEKDIKQLQSKDSKLLTAFFNLSNIDIYKFTFADKIHINDSIYTINKIIDYSPIQNKLTKVELLKQVDITTTYDSYDYSDLLPTDPPVEVGDRLIVGKDNNAKPGKNIIIVGSGNNTSGDDTLIVGKNNSSQGGSILGSSNSSTNSNTTLINTKNTKVSGDTQASAIGTNNITIKESGVYIDSLKIIDGLILDSDGLNDSGIDVVQTRFTNAGLNDSGENKLWDDSDIDSFIIEEGGED